MKLSSESFQDANFIPGEFAFCVMNNTTHVAMSDNRNPHLAWEGAPAGTKSYAVICCDGDAPSSRDDVNQENRTVQAELPRTDFFHWTLIDIPADTTSLAAGQFSDSITPRGKTGPEIAKSSLAGPRHGINDYTAWFSSDPDMAGEYFGYDGPCPPWNDLVVHRYIFTVYALDVLHVPVDGKFTGQDVRNAIKGHVLDEAYITALYTLNPDLAEPAYVKS